MNNITNAGGGSPSLVLMDWQDPWTVAAVLLFGMLAVVALYRSTRACCTCSLTSTAVPNV